MKKGFLLLLIFCKSAYCNSVASVSNHKRVVQELMEKKEEESKSNKGLVEESGERLSDQFNVDALDVVDADRVVPEDSASFEKEISQVIDKRASLSDYSTILTCLVAIFGIPGFAAVFKYKQYFTNMISSFGNKNNRSGSPEERRDGGVTRRSASPIFDVNVQDSGAGGALFRPQTSGSSRIKIDPPLSSASMQMSVDTQNGESVDELGAGLIDLIKYDRSDPGIYKFQALIDKGASINVQDCEGKTVLNLAAENGRLDVVSFLLDKGAQIDADIKYGYTPLHWAAKGGHLGVVGFLLDRGVQVNVKSKNGDTPLHVAALNGRLAVVKLLLTKGAERDAVDNEGLTALDRAASKGMLEVACLLLDEGAAIDAKDGYGNTPLHFAASGGNPRVVHLLLESGAQINAENKFGNTPLHKAVSGGKKAIAIILLKWGAAIDAKNHDGKRPFELAEKV
jgi:ankyrin repeat protein